MRTIKLFFLGIVICTSTASCSDDDPTFIEVKGTLLKQGITTYQYGTHTISGLALKSDIIELDDYLNQDITIIGCKIEGYPVDGGPDYIEVKRID